MRDIIEAKLAEIGAEENVTILYACESGSRGWQFASADSDYDVRFLYLHPIETYLAIHPRRDVIERPIVDTLDFMGWDFLKALRLLQRSNSRLLEWSSSPIVYVQPHSIITQFWQLAPTYFSPLVCGMYYHRAARHYFSLAIEDEWMHVKHIFYALRMLLAVSWIEQTDTIVPMDSWVSIDHLITEPALRAAIERLYDAKQHTAEQSRIRIIPGLQAYCTQELKRLDPIVPRLRDTKGLDEPLNRLFRQALDVQL